DRRVFRDSARTRNGPAAGSGGGLQSETAADSDDVPGNVAGHDTDGAGYRGGKRTICSAGTGNHWWLGSLRGGHGVSGACRLSVDSRKKTHGYGGGGSVKAVIRLMMVVALVTTRGASQGQSGMPAGGSTPAG